MSYTYTEDREQMIALFRQMLAAAEGGKLTAATVTLYYRDGSSKTFLAGDEGDGVTMYARRASGRTEAGN